MIERYSRKQLTDIWSEENKYQIWLDVEVAAAEAMEKMGQIPKGVASVVRKKDKINVKILHQIEVLIIAQKKITPNKDKAERANSSLCLLKKILNQKILKN